MNLAQRRKRTILKSIYFLAILSFAVVVIWIGLEIYFAYTNTPEEIIEASVLEPIEVNLYVELAGQLEAREKIDDQTLLNFAQTQPRAELETEVSETQTQATNSSTLINSLESPSASGSAAQSLEE